MLETRSRLIKCFKAVFPALSEAEILLASFTSVADWDSVAAINLLTLVEEEFGIEVPAEDIENLISFALILHYLDETYVAAGTESLLAASA
jgi:acyl carrier protein